ncbi:MAG: transcription-repair coupling factor, partial [Clostridia bacterium]|nr:transcription-repair coupling factor [Clostridia bacterium]
MKLFSNILSNLTEFCELESSVKTGKLPACVNGLGAVHKAHFIHGLCTRLDEKALVVVSDEAEAQRLCLDIDAMGGKAYFYPARDFNFRTSKGQSREFEHIRMEILSKMMAGDYTAVVCCPDAALQFTVPPSAIEKFKLSLKTGQSVSVEKVTEALIASGYEQCEQVEGSGQFARRGGIVDLFSPDSEQPVRIEFWGDEIDSMAYFDIMTQRRGELAPSVEILPSNEVYTPYLGELAEKLEDIAKKLTRKKQQPAREKLLEEAEQLRAGIRPGSFDKYMSLIYPGGTTVFDYHEGLIFVSENTKVKERIRTFEWQLGEDIKGFLEDGTLCEGLGPYAMESSDFYFLLEDRAVYLNVFATGGYETSIKTLLNVTAAQMPAWTGTLNILTEDVRAMLARKMAVVVLAGNEKNIDGIVSDLKSEGLPAEKAVKPGSVSLGRVYVCEGALSAGMDYPGAYFGLLTVARSGYGDYRGAYGLGKTARKKKNRGKEIFSLAELSPGDYVVHSTYGIGVFEGIQTIKVKNGDRDVPKEFIKIRYARDDRVYVPVTQMDLVTKYIGAKEDALIKLSSIGSGDWTRTKSRVRAAVRDIAKQLTALYAERMKQKGHAFPEDTPWQRDFEANFEFVETDDQLRCASEICSDMQSTVPMDRLLCGDVGFGKTEVAMRAAFRCVSDSAQVAVLVPTTILARQHYHTFLRRMEGFPVTVKMLSRYTPAKEKKEITEGLKKGTVDIVIGTHTLLNKNIEFSKLGLVIVDEEQRFGVTQKEKLKMRFKNIDCLTLTATPIPRTLNMALSGMRDMSIIEEAPRDRHPVQTYVLEYDPGIIAEAIRRELRRGGQVYYMHNFIDTIDSCAAHISALVPEARIGVAHGRMSEEEISEAWRRLIDNEINVLVCTTIIETGVDVANVNTLIIEQSDRLGLAQLHQIRGRVGRSSRRAYAYLTFTRGKELNETAVKRLEALREFTEFGAGFKIAMRDMEIRGAGNILGAAQHGHMEAVGYDMYLKLLEDAIREEKGEPEKPTDRECLIDIRTDARIDETYIPSLRQRLDMYRAIAAVRTQDDEEDIIDELCDRFGDPPEGIISLLGISRLRAQAQALGVKEIKQPENM